MTRATGDAPRLVGDIGGTHVVFGLAHRGTEAIAAMTAFMSDDHDGLAAVIEHYLAQQSGPRPRAAALAVAAPILDDRVTLTNRAWSFSIEALRRALGFDQLVVLNDFEALARAAPRLGPNELRPIGPPGHAVADAPIALIGPGTGLGVSAAVPVGGRWIPLVGEGGHATMAACDDREAAVLAGLRAEYGHVSAERLISGPGLVNIYRMLARLAGVAVTPTTPDRVIASGLAEAGLAREALSLFCAMLGTVAGNLALTMGARAGLYLGGGMARRLGDFLVDSGFRARFEAKGRFRDYLAAIPTVLIARRGAELRGAALALEERLA